MLDSDVTGNRPVRLEVIEQLPGFLWKQWLQIFCDREFLQMHGGCWRGRVVTKLHRKLPRDQRVAVTGIQQLEGDVAVVPEERGTDVRKLNRHQRTVQLTVSHFNFQPQIRNGLFRSFFNPKIHIKQANESRRHAAAAHHNGAGFRTGCGRARFGWWWQHAGDL